MRMCVFHKDTVDNLKEIYDKFKLVRDNLKKEIMVLKTMEVDVDGEEESSLELYTVFEYENAVDEVMESIHEMTIELVRMKDLLDKISYDIPGQQELNLEGDKNGGDLGREDKKIS